MIHLLPVSPGWHGSLFSGWVASVRDARSWGDAALRPSQFNATPSDQHAVIAGDGVPIG